MVITEVTDSMVFQVREFLSSRKEFGFSTNWDGVFQYPWKQGKFPYGYALVHEGNVIGFAGTLFCERVIAGSCVVYCNLSVWVVDDSDKRARSLAVALLAAVLRTKNAVVTCFTANQRAQMGLQKLGFQWIDRQQVALPTMAGYWGWERKGSREVLFELATIEGYLKGRDRQIFDDHRSLNCTHMLVRDTTTNEYCYLIGTTSPFRFSRLPKPARAVVQHFLGAYHCCNVCYASSPAFLGKNIGIVNRELFRKRKAAALRYDSRLIPGRLSRLEYKMATQRLCFSSASCPTTGIDGLYSELVTYNIY